MSIKHIKKRAFNAYRFGSLITLGNASLERLITIFNSSREENSRKLEGRTTVQTVSLEETGPVVIKSYNRGGLIYFLNKNKYLRIGDVRSKTEFEFLVKAGQAGVSIPEPVAYASQGFPFYRAWLITKTIKQHLSFARICRDDQQKALAMIPEVSRNIKLLIQNNIHHVDLHPGNIIVNKNNNRIYIIDFDKACYSLKTRSVLAEKYQARWTRAIIKHQLPQALTHLKLY